MRAKKCLFTRPTTPPDKLSVATTRTLKPNIDFSSSRTPRATPAKVNRDRAPSSQHPPLDRAAILPHLESPLRSPPLFAKLRAQSLAMAFEARWPSWATFRNLRNIVGTLAVLIAIAQSTPFFRYLCLAISCGFLLLYPISRIESAAQVVEPTSTPPAWTTQGLSHGLNELQLPGSFPSPRTHLTKNACASAITGTPAQLSAMQKTETRAPTAAPRLPDARQPLTRSFGHSAHEDRMLVPPNKPKKETQSIAPSPLPLVTKEKTLPPGYWDIPTEVEPGTSLGHTAFRYFKWIEDLHVWQPIPVDRYYRERAMQLAPKPVPDYGREWLEQHDEDLRKLSEMTWAAQRKEEIACIARLPAYDRDSHGRLKDCLGRFDQFQYIIQPPGYATPCRFDIRTRQFFAHNGSWKPADPDMASAPVYATGLYPSNSNSASNSDENGYGNGGNQAPTSTYEPKETQYFSLDFNEQNAVCSGDIDMGNTTVIPPTVPFNTFVPPGNNGGQANGPPNWPAGPSSGIQSNGTAPFNGTGMSQGNPSSAPANGNAGIASGSNINFTALNGVGTSQPNANPPNALPKGNAGSVFGGLNLATAMANVNNKAASSNNAQATNTTPSSIFTIGNSNNNPLSATQPTSTTSGVPQSGLRGFVLAPQNATTMLGANSSTAAPSNNTSAPQPSNPFSTASNSGSLFATQNSGNTNAPASNPFAANTTARNPFSNVSSVTLVGSGGAFAQAPPSNSGVPQAESFNTTFTTRVPTTQFGTNNFATTTIDPKGKRPANQSPLIFGNQTSTNQSSGGNAVFGSTSSPNITQPANAKKSSNGNRLPQCLDDDLYLGSMVLCDTPQKKHKWIKRKLAEPQKFVAELVYHDKPTKEWRPKFLEHCATLKKIMRAVSTDIAPFGD